MISLPYMAFAAVILVNLVPNLGDLKGPVIAYTVIIITMARLTWYRYPRTTIKSFQWFMIGAFVFVLSDLSLAIDKFMYASEYWRFFIRATYLIGEFMIIHGIIEGNKKGKNKRD